MMSRSRGKPKPVGKHKQQTEVGTGGGEAGAALQTTAPPTSLNTCLTARSVPRRFAAMGFAWLAAAAAGLAVASAADGAAPLPTCRKPAPPPPSPSGCMPVAFKLCGQFGGNTLSCEACAATHAAELGEAGCTKAQITGFCTSPLGKCEAQLFKDGCITAGPQGCTVCAASHRKDLTKVCASEQEVEQLCKDATHPAARFVREGEPRVTAHALGYDIIEETLVTQSYFLADGELIFTDFDSTPIPMPTGDYAILSLGGEMVVRAATLARSVISPQLS